MLGTLCNFLFFCRSFHTQSFFLFCKDIVWDDAIHRVYLISYILVSHTFKSKKRKYKGRSMELFRAKTYHIRHMQQPYRQSPLDRVTLYSQKNSKESASKKSGGNLTHWHSCNGIKQLTHSAKKKKNKS